MSFAGVQTWYSDGSEQIALTDRLTRFAASGELYIPSIYPPANGIRDVAVPGITNDGTWHVNCTGSVVIEIFNGYFRVQRIDRREWFEPSYENEIDYLYYTVMKL